MENTGESPMKYTESFPSLETAYNLISELQTVSREIGVIYHLQIGQEVRKRMGTKIRFMEEDDTGIRFVEEIWRERNKGKGSRSYAEDKENEDLTDKENLD